MKTDLMRCYKNQNLTEPDGMFFIEWSDSQCGGSPCWGNNQHRPRSVNFFNYLIGNHYPDKRFRIFAVCFDVAHDRIDRFRNAMKSASSYTMHDANTFSSVISIAANKFVVPSRLSSCVIGLHGPRTVGRHISKFLPVPIDY